jgi:hypothetical protein
MQKSAKSFHSKFDRSSLVRARAHGRNATTWIRRITGAYGRIEAFARDASRRIGTSVESASASASLRVVVEDDGRGGGACTRMDPTTTLPTTTRDAGSTSTSTMATPHDASMPREFKFAVKPEDEEREHPCRREPPGVDAKLGGFAFFEAMGSPRYHVAPMVDQSELAFRELCRRHGATLGYTPMIHARLFVESPKYRREIFSTSATDRPLLAQFCANDPDVLLEAATMIAPYCDGVDINFGCPQRIAKRGNYGAFLMDDWKTVESLIRTLDESLPVPVTAKIRVYDDLETTLKYAKMVEAAGAQIVAVHGRTREQKRCAEVRANWYARRLRRKSFSLFFRRQTI